MKNLDQILTGQQAHFEFKNNKVIYSSISTQGLDELKNKQVPKKPIYGNFDDNGFGIIVPYKAVCPVCSYEFEFGTWNDEENHHCICGQAMNWER